MTSQLITLEEYYMGRDEHYPPTDVLRANALDTVRKANQLLVSCEIQRGVRSGYRPASINAKVPGAALYSKHITCQAIDIEDNDGKLKSWCLKNLNILEDIGLWMESPESTPSWCHVQTLAPKSGHRVFLP